MSSKVRHGSTRSSRSRPRSSSTDIVFATSRDGLHWDRPDLDIQPGTNRVLPVDMNCDSWTVVLDHGAVLVDDQEKALRFYTDVLGFEKKRDIPVGEYRWITVTSPEGPDDLELALEGPYR